MRTLGAFLFLSVLALALTACCSDNAANPSQAVGVCERMAPVGACQTSAGEVGAGDDEITFQGRVGAGEIAVGVISFPPEVLACLIQGGTKVLQDASDTAVCALNAFIRMFHPTPGVYAVRMKRPAAARVGVCAPAAKAPRATPCAPPAASTPCQPSPVGATVCSPPPQATIPPASPNCK